jgi:hypothetical protein
MADTNTREPRSQAAEESFYWQRVFLRYEMTIGDAETLAFGAGVDRHAVRAALEHGCKPRLAVKIFAPI